MLGTNVLDDPGEDLAHPDHALAGDHPAPVDVVAARTRAGVTGAGDHAGHELGTVVARNGHIPARDLGGEQGLVGDDGQSSLP
ncbi:hypothetical protein ACFT7U_32265 [Streptomyces rochei]|uniref:hypothetical protein n=1 Tax=Streptomyces rochei TaxID=1928 RepID=UPI00363A39D8